MKKDNSQNGHSNVEKTGKISKGTFPHLKWNGEIFHSSCSELFTLGVVQNFTLEISLGFMKMIFCKNLKSKWPTLC